MTRLVWDDRALDDLVAIADNISQDHPKSAARVVGYIRRATALLENTPLLGKASVDDGVREFVLTRYPYVIVYESVDEDVRVLAVFHHRQQRD